VSINGADGVYLNVLRIPGGNTIDIVEAVKSTIANIPNLPPGMVVKPIFDQSTFVRSSYSGLKKEILQALVLVALVILVFLQSVRGTVIVSVAIPLSFAITLIVLNATGQTLNVFTLGGLTLVMGRLVDNAVVVLESIHRHRKEGLSSAQAAYVGTKVVVLPVLASTLTTMAVLLPVLLFAGLAQKLFVPLAITVAVAMAASFFVSVMLTPVACRYLLRDTTPGPTAQKLEHKITAMATGYARLLDRVLDTGWAIVAGSLILVIASGWIATHLPSVFFPQIDESMERIYVRLAPGASIQESSRKMQEMGDDLKKKLPGIDLVLTNTGSPKAARSAMSSPNWGPNMGFIRLGLTDPETRSDSQQEIADQARAILVHDFPGVDFLQWPGGLVASVFSNGYNAPLVVEVRADSLEALESESRAVAEVARTVGGVRDVWQTFESDYPEVHIDTDRERIGTVGVSARGAAQATLDATVGNINTPSVWVDGGNGEAYYLVTEYDDKRINDTAALRTIPLRIAANGAAVTLGSYGVIRRSTGPIAIERNQLQRASHVMMQTEGRDLGTAASELEAKLKSDPRTSNIKFEFVGQIELMRNTFSGLGLGIGLAIMVVFMIMAAQFKSLRMPLVMLFTIPCTLIGIVLALLAGGMGFSITALMGVLMVVGIAVSNGILLIDHARIKLDEGLDKRAAILDAARVRFVPIAMTSLATVIGLIPTAVGLDPGADANRPLALAVVGGLTSSTLLSLFLVPVIFMALAKRSEPTSLE
jgi:multidrug efflux pump subunit AcrB